MDSRRRIEPDPPDHATNDCVSAARLLGSELPCRRGGEHIGIDVVLKGLDIGADHGQAVVLKRFKLWLTLRFGPPRQAAETFSADQPRS